MPDDKLRGLERVGYFYNRGAETTRLETFVDAAFAFALTLLVISFDAVPNSYDELIHALRAIPAFLFGFMILMMFWVGHRNWSIRYGLDTTLASLISLALVFIILVYVYPLRAMSTAAVSAMTNRWLPTTFEIVSIGQVRGLFVIYGSGFFLCTLCLALLNMHALGERLRLALTAEEVFLTRTEVASWLIMGAVGLASIILAVTLPQDFVGLSGWLYASLAVIMPFFGWSVSRRYDRRFGTAPTD